MAGEDEAREGGENAQRSESPAFGRRSAAAPSSSGKLAKVAAAAGRAEYVLRAAADLKPQGLSWGLVLCVAATVALGVLALINRPQIDDDAAYYVAAGVLIFVALIADRFGILTARRPVVLSVLTLVGAIAYSPLVEGYWYAWAQYWKQSGPWPNPADPTIEDLLAFDHPWCDGWTDHLWFCRKSGVLAWNDGSQQPFFSDEALWSESRSTATSECKRLKRLSQSARRILCTRSQVPVWCLEWWDGGQVKTNPQPQWSARSSPLGGDPAYQPNLPASSYPGKCVSSMWDQN